MSESDWREEGTCLGALRPHAKTPYCANWEALNVKPKPTSWWNHLRLAMAIFWLGAFGVYVMLATSAFLSEMPEVGLLFVGLAVFSILNLVLHNNALGPVHRIANDSY